jgi:hypothetical protein
MDQGELHRKRLNYLKEKPGSSGLNQQAPVLPGRLPNWAIFDT